MRCRSLAMTECDPMMKRLINVCRWPLTLLLSVLLVQPASAFQLGIFGIGPVEEQRRDVVAMYLFRGKSEAVFRQGIEDALLLRVDRLRQVCDLDESQVKKLELAVRGDTSRLFREIAELREQTKDYDMNNQEEANEAWQAIMPMQQRLASDVFPDGSLLDRIQSKILDEAQAKKLADFEARRREKMLRSIVRMTLTQLELTVPVTAEQREKLLELLSEQALPKGKVNDQVLPYLGYTMLARLEDEHLNEVLDENQYKILKRYIDQFANMPNLGW